MKKYLYKGQKYSIMGLIRRIIVSNTTQEKKNPF